ncbi:hypothetical protein cce_5282 (plasmid) [Crocosphaera subtropica ATCC 51142]|uniref:Uncharacterized protein n=1 Tax=Crocosphaera subtropica (strain ATCC 51142 / BH68) TaxID=43989 RepID=B1X3B7_CROS5|nr:hypothetical protein [Crocosphaera subtropica]ACB54628.1 hypothetical protein cce_5282 [Crocosphaera subtropica ATCC 51142]
MKKKTGKQQNYQHLTPSTVTGQRLTQYYHHGWDFILEIDDKWTTINIYPLSPREIWDKHQDPQITIGLRFGSTTRHITIDIDRNSPYHPFNDPDAIKTITEALESIGLCRHVLIQSSDSQGIHLIFALPEPLHTFKTACLVKATLEAAQLEIKTGQLEIFPNPKRYAKNGKKSCYNGVRLPLQPNSGSYLLDQDLNIISDSVEDFLDQMDWAAEGQDIETFSSRLDVAYQEFKAQRSWQKAYYSPTAIAWKQALEKLLELGWTGHHQTNYLLTKFVAYHIVFKELTGAKLRAAVIEEVINAPGYNQWCRHQHEIEQRIEEICYYTERNEYYLPYCNYPNRSSNYNQTYNKSMDKTPRTLDIEKRITETVAHLEANGELPQKVVERRQAIIKIAKEKYGTGFSNRTLSQKKYLALWHPKYRSNQEKMQSHSQRETASITEPQKSPETDQTAPPTKQAETHSQSESASYTPIYEVFEGLEFDPQKKSKNNPTTFQKSKPPTDPPLSDAPVQLSELPDDLPDHLANRLASVHSAKQAFLNLGLFIPYGLKRLEAELMAEIAQLTPSNDESITKPNQPPSNGKIDAVEDTTEPTPSTPEAPQVDDTTNQSPTIEQTLEIEEGRLQIDQNNQPLSTNQRKINNHESPTSVKQPGVNLKSPICNLQSHDNNQFLSSTNGQPRKLSKKKLLEKCDDYGIEVNRTIERLIKSNTSEVVLNALEALREHKRQGQVKNPAGFLVKAIKQKWKPTTATNTPQTSSKPSSSPYLSNPTAGITDEFLQWYEKQIARGLVENVPVHHLPLYQHREPMVKVLTPDGKFPFDLMRWTRARDIF